jgi:hypothetical protein
MCGGMTEVLTARTLMTEVLTARTVMTEVLTARTVMTTAGATHAADLYCGKICNVKSGVAERKSAGM